MDKAAVIEKRQPRVVKQISLDPEQLHRLQTFARQMRLSESEVARRAIDTFILRSALQRIEAECIAQHGEWDWELLPEDVQDEYDAACAELSRIQQGDTPPKPFEQVMRELGITSEELARVPGEP